MAKGRLNTHKHTHTHYTEIVISKQTRFHHFCTQTKNSSQETLSIFDMIVDFSAFFSLTSNWQDASAEGL